MRVRLPAASLLTRSFLSLSLSAVLFSGLASTAALAADNSREAIAERLKPVGELCLKGETCSDESQATAASQKAPDTAPKAAQKTVTSAGMTSANEHDADETETAAADSAEEGTATDASSSHADIDGEKVYGTICMACHTTGAAGAPRLGEAGDWEARLSQGNETLYTHAIEGIGAMPAKGGNPGLSDDEVKAAVDYLVDSVR